MGRKNKLQRFAEMATFPNVYEIDPGRESFLSNVEGLSRDLRGNWALHHFTNDNPIILELACGKGDYTLALAMDHPSINFIGVDIKGARMWVGARKAFHSGLQNVAFLRTRIEFIDRFFSPEEVSEIWITFPDPFPGKENRRLISPPFLDRFRNILKKDGIVHLKTDSDLLYEYALEVIAADAQCQLIYESNDIYSGPLAFKELKYQTFYEKMHLEESKIIKYLRFAIRQ